MFRVIIRGWNCEKYLGKCLRSLIKQSCPDWKATVILDAPEDGSVKLAKAYSKKEPRISVFVNKTRVGVAANILTGITKAGPDDEDIVIIYDSDDELTHDALETVLHYYNKDSKLLLTYGSYLRTDKHRRTKTSKAYKHGRPVRKQRWHASHLKSFKYKLFKHYKSGWLKDDNGNWFQGASDVALMLPLIEMAGFDRTKHIHKIIYKWNYTKHKTRGHVQKRNKDMIYKRKPVERVEV